MNRKETEAWAEAKFAPLVEGSGCELADTEFVQEHNEWYLRFYIDKETGINVDDCQAVSKLIGAALDEDDPIAVPYNLEVCSPGLDRILKKDRDFTKYAGHAVDVKLYKKFNEKKEWTGTLIARDDKTLRIVADGAEIIFDTANVAQVRLGFDIKSGG